MLVCSVVTLVAVLQASSWVDPARHQTQMVNVAAGVQLEVLDFGGTGRPIVLLAGLGNTAHVYDELAPRLTGVGHVYAVTRRGYGASSRPQSGYDVARLGEDVLAVIETLRLEKPVLVGHSMAGKDFPSLPSPPPTPPAVARPPFTLPEAERRQPRGETTAREAIPAGGRQFTKIGLPALAIFASPHDTGAATPDPAFDRFDEAVTERQARAFERGVPGARVLRWPRASHYLFLTRPADVITEVTAFVAGLR